MKVAVVSSSTFVSGEGRMQLRRQSTARKLKEQADAARDRLCSRISTLADRRLLLLIPWWQHKFPKRELRILFGNGDHYVEIDGKTLDMIPDADGRLHWHRRARIPQTSLQPLLDALDDIVIHITDNYRDGSPDDFVIEPIRKKGIPE